MVPLRNPPSARVTVPLLRSTESAVSASRTGGAWPRIAPHTQTVELPDVIDEVQPTVVQISHTMLGQSPGALREYGVPGLVYSRPLGTGFIVSAAAHVITAQHVVEATRRLPASTPHVRVHFGIGLAYPNSENMRGNFHVCGFDVVGEDTRHDLALLQMGANPFTDRPVRGIEIGGEGLEPLYAVAGLRTERPRDGDAVAVSGYPLHESVLVTNSGVVASSWGVSIYHVDDPQVRGHTLPELQDVYLADVQTNPGNSGGPVYSAGDGAVLGVLVAGKLTDVLVANEMETEPLVIQERQVLADAGLSLVTPIKYAIEMLEASDVVWRAAPNP